MMSTIGNPILSLVVLSFIFIGCESDQNKTGLTQKVVADQTSNTRNPDEQEIIAAVEKLLFAAGNYNIDVLDEMTSDKAMIGVSNLKDGVWSNSEITIDEYFESVRKRDPRPYCEIPTDYDILVTEGRLALVRADGILHRYGVPQAREINHFTMMKEDEDWTFLNISFTVDQIAEEERKFDLDIFARSYAQAWGSMRPEFVALFFTENGSLQVNDGDPAVGKEAIANVAEGFMTDLPDMIVRYDSLVPKANGTEFHWTLIATNTGPSGTGNKVEVSGYELWQLDASGLIQKSLGSFPSEEYNRQLKIGVDH